MRHLKTSILNLIGHLAWFVSQKSWLLIIQFLMIHVCRQKTTPSYIKKRIWHRGRIKHICGQKKVYFTPRTHLSINSNDVEPLCIEINHKKDKNILFSVIYRRSNGDMKLFESFGKTCFPQMIKHRKTLFLLVIWTLPSYTMNLIRKFNTS